MSIVLSGMKLSELEKLTEEMKASRFSTRLQLPSSQKIVALYYKRYKKKSYDWYKKVIASNGEDLD